MSHIRPIAICVFRYRDRILVTEYTDPPPEPRLYYRPLGGAIELGESSVQTIVREIQEELGESVTQLRLLGTLENIYTIRGNIGHEIVQVYDGQFQNSALYDQAELRAWEDNAEWLRVLWKPLDDFAGGNPPLYPNGLYELLYASRPDQTLQDEILTTSHDQSDTIHLTSGPDHDAQPSAQNGRAPLMIN
jgi:8-oxo-dGTP pyrophosphatase MutT (NUDIX family)